MRASPSQIPPPPAVKADDVVDDYYGTKVADPYRWLEDESLPQTVMFMEAQNARTRAALDSPARDQIKQRLTALMDFPRQSAPLRKGKYAFFSTNSGLQNQSVVHVTEKIGDPGHVLIDPNQLSPDGTISLRPMTYSQDGTILAYGLAQSGSDHSEIRVKNVAAGEDLSDVIPPARQGGIEWKHDNSGFYYGKYPRTTEHGKNEQAVGYQLFFHKLGTPAKDDVLVYERPDDREMAFNLVISEDGKYEYMFLNRGTKREGRFYWRDAAAGGEWNKLIDNEDASYGVVENDGPVLFVHTTQGAPRGRVVAIDLSKPDASSPQNWKTIIPESTDVLSSVNLLDEKFVTTYLHDAHDVLKIFGKDGSFQRDVPLPTIGSVGGLNPDSTRRSDTDFFYTFTSFAYPATIFRYDLRDNTGEVVFAPKVKFDPSQYETQQLFAASKDGTKVPVFVTYRQGMKMDGTNPSLLSGYGGFNISSTPSFSASRIAWLERGGVFAEACMRGGGEYGDQWHKAGMFEHKQNVFDDFQAAAQMLVDQKFTTNKRLAIQGGSNGGLLVAACMLQRPDLYGAVVCQVPLTDMLRYQKIGIGRFWTVEYGSADASAEQFKYLYAYSPLHNVKPGQVYPPILITTSAGDNRVVPCHSLKFAATLQANASAGGNPVLLRIESKAGHGGGKPTSKIIDETADVYTFLDRMLAP